MIETLITVLIILIFAGIAFWLIQQLPLPEPWSTGIKIVAILLCLLILLSVVFGYGTLPKLRL